MVRRSEPDRVMSGTVPLKELPFQCTGRGGAPGRGSRRVRRDTMNVGTPKMLRSMRFWVHMSSEVRDRQTHRVLVRLLPALLAACSVQQPSLPPKDEGMHGTAISLMCPHGQAGAAFPWQLDPTLAGVRYIRDPGPSQRCLRSERDASFEPGTRLLLRVREGELVILGIADSK